MLTPCKTDLYNADTELALEIPVEASADVVNVEH